MPQLIGWFGGLFDDIWNIGTALRFEELFGPLNSSICLLICLGGLVSIQQVGEKHPWKGGFWSRFLYANLSAFSFASALMSGGTWPVSLGQLSLNGVFALLVWRTVWRRRLNAQNNSRARVGRGV